MAIFSLQLVQCEGALPLNTTNWKNVLMISAHPDDIEACAGGLVASLTAQVNLLRKIHLV